jgi:hypothetical protein
VRARVRGFILLSVEILILSARKSGKKSEKRMNSRHTHSLAGVFPRTSPIIQHHWVRASGKPSARKFESVCVHAFSLLSRRGPTQNNNNSGGCKALCNGFSVQVSFLLGC